MPTRTEIETALDKGHLWIAINNGNYWVARRNGATKLWKKRPDEYRIPFKYGLYGYGQLTEANERNFGDTYPAYFVISDTQPASGKSTRKNLYL